jgi:catechol 2,3-dioxygenase
MAFQMPVDASLKGLTLRTHDREPLLGFYRDLLGLSESGSDGAITLSPGNGGFTLTLEVNPQAPPRLARSLGLYHFAFLLPTRAALAAILRKLMERGWKVDGASDHIVSEAVYLRDPEGNGIELARDRPKKEWRYTNGKLAMVTDMLDVDSLLADSSTASALHPGTRLGHMHLSVDDLSQGEAFYAGALGLTVTQRTYPGALFLAAGGYHHHLGMNIWGARRPSPAGATGLVGYSWRLPRGSTAVLKAHLDHAGIPYDPRPSGITVVDPFGLSVGLHEA